MYGLKKEAHQQPRSHGLGVAGVVVGRFYCAAGTRMGIIQDSTQPSTVEPLWPVSGGSAVAVLLEDKGSGVAKLELKPKRFAPRAPVCVDKWREPVGSLCLASGRRSLAGLKY